MKRYMTAIASASLLAIHGYAGQSGTKYKDLIETTVTVSSANGATHEIGGIWLQKKDANKDKPGIKTLTYTQNTRNEEIIKKNISFNAWVRVDDPQSRTTWVPIKAFAIDLGFESLHVTAVDLPPNSTVSVALVRQPSDIGDLQIVSEASANTLNRNTDLQVMGVPYMRPLDVVLVIFAGPPQSEPRDLAHADFDAYITVFHNYMDPPVDPPSGAPISFTDVANIVASFPSTSDVRPLLITCSSDMLATVRVSMYDGVTYEMPHYLRVISLDTGEVSNVSIFPRIPPFVYFPAGRCRVEAVWYPWGEYPTFR